MFVFAGIWYEWADEVKEICAGGDLTVSRIHTHIGSGSDPAVWQKVCAGFFYSRGWRRALYSSCGSCVVLVVIVVVVAVVVLNLFMERRLKALWGLELATHGLRFPPLSFTASRCALFRNGVPHC